MEDFFLRLNKLLDDIGCTNYKLSKTLDISEANISNYRKGKAKPGVEFFTQLLKYFEVYSMNWLFTGKGKMKLKISEDNSNDDTLILEQISTMSEQLELLKKKILSK